MIPQTSHDSCAVPTLGTDGRGSAWWIGTPGSSGPAPRNSSRLPNFKEHPRARDHGVHGGEAFHVSSRVCLGRAARDLGAP